MFTLSDDLSGIALPGDRFELRRHHTLEGLFGRENAKTLTAGLSADTADTVQFMRPGTGAVDCRQPHGRRAERGRGAPAAGPRRGSPTAPRRPAARPAAQSAACARSDTAVTVSPSATTSASTSTRTASPSTTAPERIALASLSPISRCTSRRSGRAP